MEQMKKSTVDWEKTKNIPVPEYDWKKGSPQEFYETYVKNPHPVILRNFMEGTELLECTYDKMLEKYGEETVALSGLKNASFGKLKDVQNPGVYLQNSEAIFNRHPGWFSNMKHLVTILIMCNFSFRAVEVAANRQTGGLLTNEKQLCPVFLGPPRHRCPTSLRSCMELFLHGGWSKKVVLHWSNRLVLGLSKIH